MESVSVEDNAQAPLATENGVLSGTIGHIGVFSLNRHKHIQTGEGGGLHDDTIPIGVSPQLICNHGENLIEHHAAHAERDLVGFNYRLTELSQPSDLRNSTEPRKSSRNARHSHWLSSGVSGSCLTPHVRVSCATPSGRHAGYDENGRAGYRGAFLQAMAAEGCAVGRRCAGATPTPTLRFAARSPGGAPECPVTEQMQRKRSGFGICALNCPTRCWSATVAAAFPQSL